MKIVVTGGSGPLGRIVIAELSGQGYEVLSLDRIPHPAHHRPSWIVELSEPGSIFEACRDAFAVVHLAAFSAPNISTDCNVFNTNVSITYNVLKAASDMGVSRVVLASSTAAYGYIYGSTDMLPDYLPVDEEHSSRPVDSYGLSKVVCERIATSFAAASEMRIASLRLPGINFDPEFKRLKERMADPGARRSGFWAYIDARDAAIACRLALESDLNGHRVFNLAAPTTSMREPTKSLVQQFMPGVVDLRVREDTRWSGINSRRAERELGFQARYLWEDSDDS